MATHMNGRLLASQIEQHLAMVIAHNKDRAGRPPGLAVIRVGDDSASGIYVANKERACERIGISRHGVHIPKNITLQEMIATIKSLNIDPKVDAILLQLPLPSSLEEGALLQAIDPEKDADGIHTLNLGRLLKGEPGPRSCTPAGIMALLSYYKIELTGKHSVVVGRSILVGKPMSLMLQAANSTVSVAHSYTTELAQLTRQADVLVVATGKPKIIGKEHIKPGAVIIDVGIHRLESKKSENSFKKFYLCGDVRIEEAEYIASIITPVPGGVGPMTVTMLLMNTVMNWGSHFGLNNPLADLLLV
uniref:Methylenetetrahydrofolate dehydrogenase (NADP+) n=1 Tax=Paulinella chromatophora TaxID=39717 RepID=B1X5H3_PAUCH|nr:Methylenetetrahydrofolate dehydrogenase (NADP+) [Paulinella chromatophora]ACB43192.1 Methylenetetrahydrofolate dehydrogenase (NADP+) [Paulinella chromatophora]